MNLYHDNGRSALHDNKIEAEQVAKENRIACVKVVIDCEEGEGL